MDLANLILNTIMLILIISGITILVALFVRQRRDLQQGILLQAAMDDDQRRIRHAIIEIAAHAKMQSIVEMLSTPTALRDAVHDDDDGDGDHPHLK